MSNTSNVGEDVGVFFDGYAEEFDSIYGYNPDRSFFDKIADRLFRQAMYKRFQETLSILSDVKIKSVLDVGSGSGRYAVEFLNLNKSVTGIDLAENMIILSKKIVESKFTKPEATFIHGDYIQHVFDQKFDSAVLMGFFDYIEDATVVLNKLKKDVPGIIMASIPKENHFLSFQRKTRYKKRNCPLYLYTYDQLIALLDICDFKKYDIIDNGREYFLKIDNR
jgi:2-polyprenyl-3-methyl-5-hydroxy-6-metoxy-1,4-benzoquinol methylase